MRPDIIREILRNLLIINKPLIWLFFRLYYCSLICMAMSYSVLAVFLYQSEAYQYFIRNSLIDIMFQPGAVYAIMATVVWTMLITVPLLEKRIRHYLQIAMAGIDNRKIELQQQVVRMQNSQEEICQTLDPDAMQFVGFDN